MGETSEHCEVFMLIPTTKLVRPAATTPAGCGNPYGRPELPQFPVGSKHTGKRLQSEGSLPANIHTLPTLTALHLRAANLSQEQQMNLGE